MCNSIDFDIFKINYQSHFSIWSHLAVTKCINNIYICYLYLPIYPFIKIAISLDPVMKFGCLLRFTISYFLTQSILWLRAMSPTARVWRRRKDISTTILYQPYKHKDILGFGCPLKDTHHHIIQHHHHHYATISSNTQPFLAPPPQLNQYHYNHHPYHQTYY